MVTWTTYGTWLQGDRQGYVKRNKILKRNPNLKRANIARQRGKTIKLTRQQREIVYKAIERAAVRIGQKIYSIAVCSNHVHIVVDYTGRPLEDLVRRYKMAGYFALRKNGFAGRVWTRGYDKRFCFDEESLQKRIDYVQRHDR